MFLFLFVVLVRIPFVDQRNESDDEAEENSEDYVSCDPARVQRLAQKVSADDKEYSDDDDEYSEEVDDGENSELFTLFGLSQSDEEEDEDEEDEDEDAWDSGEAVFDEDAEAEEDDTVQDDEEEDDDSSDDFMDAFCSFAAKLKEMSPFERLRANGQDVAEITLDDLIEEAKVRMERRRTH